MKSYHLLIMSLSKLDQLFVGIAFPARQFRKVNNYGVN